MADRVDAVQDHNTAYTAEDRAQDEQRSNVCGLRSTSTVKISEHAFFTLDLMSVSSYSSRAVFKKLLKHGVLD